MHKGLLYSSRLALRIPLALFALVGCAAEGSDSSTESIEDSILRNEDVVHRFFDGDDLCAIAAPFARFGLEPTSAPSVAAWPIRTDERAVLSRFGTPIRIDDFGYAHSAMDVVRIDLQDSDDVLAPVTGRLTLSDWSGNPVVESTDPYRTVVSVYDEATHLVYEMMHVRPTASVLQRYLASTTPQRVTRGQVVGRLARLNFLPTQHEQKFRHTHVSVVDGQACRSRNPALHLPYVDATPPTVQRAYLLDERSQEVQNLRNGKLDVVLQVADRDRDSDRNLEISKIDFRISNQSGRVLHQCESCSMDEIFSRQDYENDPTPNFVDFGRRQNGLGDWPNSNLDHRTRTFGYALTQLQRRGEGETTFLSDRQGFIEIGNDTDRLLVEGSAYDALGNATPFRFEFTRTAPSADAGVDASASDAATGDAGSGDAGSQGRLTTNQLCDLAEQKYHECGHPFPASCPLVESLFAENESTRDSDRCAYSRRTAEYYECIAEASCRSFAPPQNGATSWAPSQCVWLRGEVNSAFNERSCLRYDESDMSWPQPSATETVRLMSGPDVCDYHDQSYLLPRGEGDQFVVTRFVANQSFSPTKLRLRMINNNFLDGCDVNGQPLEFWLVKRSASTALSTLANEWNPSRTEQHYLFEHNQWRSFEDDVPLAGLSVRQGEAIDLVVRVAYANRGGNRTCLMLCDTHASQLSTSIFASHNGTALVAAPRSASVIRMDTHNGRNDQSVQTMARNQTLFAAIYGQ